MHQTTIIMTMIKTMYRPVKTIKTWRAQQFESSKIGTQAFPNSFILRLIALRQEIPVALPLRKIWN